MFANKKLYYDVDAERKCRLGRNSSSNEPGLRE
jgi:hypothetical protein